MIRCFTPEQTALYERGYPHVVLLVDDHKDDKKPDPTKIYTKQYFGAYHVHWPRKVAQAFVRAASAAPDAPVDASPIDVVVARAAIAKELASPRPLSVHRDEHVVLCIEALVGTDVTLGLLVDALCALPPERWPARGSAFDPDTLPQPPQMALAIHRSNAVHRNGNVGYFAYLTGYLLLRASPDAAARARATLEDLWQRAAGVLALEETLHGGLDLALHGSDGARRVFPDSHWQYLHWWGFVDDPALFRARFAEKRKSDWVPDARHIWLCPEIMDHVFQKKLIRGLGDRRASFFEDVAMFDHPRVEQLMRENVDDKRAGAIATQWLAEHR